jgi:solute:Na+ symporter, SSS family
MIETIDLVVIVFYLLAMIGLGFWASSKIKSNEDYALAGRSLGWPVLTGSLIGTIIGGVATLGNAGKAYEVGYVVVIANLSYFFGYILLAVIAPRLRSAGIESVPDALQKRYGRAPRVLSSVIIFLTVMIIFTAQLIACGVIATMVLADLGISYEQAVIIGAVVIVLYTVVGGLLAVAYTDMLQSVILLIGIGLLLPIFLVSDVGGWDQAVELLQSKQESFMAGMQPGYLLALIPTYLAVVLIDPAAWQRIAAAKKVEHLRPALLATAGVFLFWSLLIAALGVLAFNLYPDLALSDQVIPTLIFEHMPPVVKGLCLVAILAILMSSADSLLLIAGTTVSRDIVPSFKQDVGDKTLLKINRYTIFTVGALGGLIALSQISLFDITVIAYGIFVAGLFIPVMSALFLKRATWLCATSSGVSGAIAVVVSFAVRKSGVELPVEPIFIGLGASVLGLVISMTLSHSRRSTEDEKFTEKLSPLLRS